MDINDVFGQKTETPTEVECKPPGISPFDFLNAINYTKENLIVDDWSEKQYTPYVINKGLSYSADTVIYANEMNSRPHLGKLLQFQFLINSVRPRKRFNKWIKGEKIDAMETVKEYYGYSSEKAKSALSILSNEQVNHLKEKLKKGGI